MNNRPSKESETYSPTDSIVAGVYSTSVGYRTQRVKGSTTHLLIVTIEGNGRFEHGRGAEAHFHDVGHGDVALYRPNTPHDFSALNDWRFFFAHFTPPARWAPALDWPEAHHGLSICKIESDEYDKSLPALVEVGAEWGRGAVGVNVALALLESFIWRVWRATGEGSGFDLRVRKGISALLMDDRLPFSPERLAEAMGLSPSRASHLFSEQVGEPPRRFLERHRMERARALLRTGGQTIKEVARSVGYDNEFYFSRRYHEHWGRAPSADRDPD